MNKKSFSNASFNRSSNNHLRCSPHETQINFSLVSFISSNIDIGSHLRLHQLKSFIVRRKETKELTINDLSFALLFKKKEEEEEFLPLDYLGNRGWCT